MDIQQKNEDFLEFLEVSLYLYDVQNHSIKYAGNRYGCPVLLRGR